MSNNIQTTTPPQATDIKLVVPYVQRKLACVLLAQEIVDSRLKV